MIRFIVENLLDEIVYLVSVGEKSKRETPVPNWLVRHRLLPLAADLRLDHGLVEAALMAQSEIDSIEELCDCVFSTGVARLFLIGSLSSYVFRNVLGVLFFAYL